MAEVLEFEVARLAGTERLVEREWEGVTYDTWTYELDGRTVWGVTGRILHALLDLLRREGWRWT